MERAHRLLRSMVYDIARVQETHDKLNFIDMKDFNKTYRNTTARRLAQQIQNSPTFRLHHDFFIEIEDGELLSYKEDAIIDELEYWEESIVEEYTNIGGSTAIIAAYEEAL